jgi:hypothetical protein
LVKLKIEEGLEFMTVYFVMFSMAPRLLKLDIEGAKQGLMESRINEIRLEQSIIDIVVKLSMVGFGTNIITTAAIMATDRIGFTKEYNFELDFSFVMKMEYDYQMEINSKWAANFHFKNH